MQASSYLGSVSSADFLALYFLSLSLLLLSGLYWENGNVSSQVIENGGGIVC